MRTSPVSRRLISILGAALLVASITWTLAPAAMAFAPPCSVKNLDTGVVSGDLQAQLDAATNGDTLKIQSICTGTFTVDRKLTLKGHQPSGYPEPTLHGNLGGTVLTVEAGAKVQVRNLLITGGTGSTVDTFCCGTGNGGGGIVNHGVLTLKGSTLVSGNSAADGGGILNCGLAELSLKGTTVVSGNSADLVGGGVYNDSGGIIAVKDSARVNDNSASSGGGFFSDSGGTITLNDAAQVNGNDADYAGGVWNFYGTITLNDAAQVNGNDADSGGGGIFNDYATTTLNGSAQVNGNSAGYYGGGGIYNQSATLTLNASAQVNGNSADADGGGIYSFGLGTATLNDSAQVNGNSADYDSGGGIYNYYYATLTLNDAAQVNGNTAGGGIVRCDSDILNGAIEGVNVKDNVPFDIGSCP